MVDEWYVIRTLEALGHGRALKSLLKGFKRDYALDWYKNQVSKSFLD